MAEDETGQTPTLTNFERLLPYAGPATAALTGVLYISGYVRTNALLARYGLPRGSISSSIDQTMAIGFPPLMVLMTLFGIYMLATLAIGKLYSAYLHKKAPNFIRMPLETVLHKTNVLIFSRTGRLINTVNYAVLLLLAGLLSGMTGSLFDYISYSVFTTEGCKTYCMDYRVNGKIIRGRAVISDGKVTVIKTGHGVSLIKSDDISEIWPVSDKNNDIPSSLFL